MSIIQAVYATLQQEGYLPHVDESGVLNFKYYGQPAQFRTSTLIGVTIGELECTLPRPEPDAAQAQAFTAQRPLCHLIGRGAQAALVLETMLTERDVEVQIQLLLRLLDGYSADFVFANTGQVPLPTTVGEKTRLNMGRTAQTALQSSASAPVALPPESAAPATGHSAPVGLSRPATPPDPPLPATPSGPSARGFGRPTPPPSPASAEATPAPAPAPAEPRPPLVATVAEKPLTPSLSDLGIHLPEVTSGPEFAPAEPEHPAPAEPAPVAATPPLMGLGGLPEARSLAAGEVPPGWEETWDLLDRRFQPLIQALALQGVPVPDEALMDLMEDRQVRATAVMMWGSPPNAVVIVEEGQTLPRGYQGSVWSARQDPEQAAQETLAHLRASELL